MLSKKPYNNLIELAALETEREGMLIENHYKILNNLPLIYEFEDFLELANTMRKLKLK